jgi:hypothetical protein
METDFPEVAHQYDSIGLRRFVALCRELQRAAGNGPIFLAVRTADRLLGVDPTTAGLCYAVYASTKF